MMSKRKIDDYNYLNYSYYDHTDLADFIKQIY